jgi:hypothetical protein
MVNKYTKQVNLEAVEEGSDLFNELNVAATTGTGIPDDCTIPVKGKLSFGVLTFNTLKDDNGNPRKALAIEVILPNGETTAVSINSLTRGHLTENPAKLPDNTFDTRGKTRKATLNVLQGISTMDYTPAEIVEKFLCGKRIKQTSKAIVYVPKYGEDHKPKSYDKAEKKFFTVTDVAIENQDTTQTT